MNFEKTYELANNPPASLSWDAYRELVVSEVEALKDSADANDESQWQFILEKHPCLIPGSRSASMAYGHMPFPGAVISQPALIGYQKKVPDFLWIATNSESVFLVFIEIETPMKKWFTKDGTQHSDLTRALQQLTDWKQWFNNPNNLNVFLDAYGIAGSYLSHRAIQNQYVLVHGSRSEFKDRPDFNKARSYLARENEYLMTFDRLTPDFESSQALCCKLTTTGYRAISVPACIMLGPSLAGLRSLIGGKADVISKTPWISEERKQFLIERMSYWDSWARGPSGTINAGHRE